MDNAEVAETPDVPAKDVEVAEKVLEPEAMGTDGGARILQTAVRQPPGSVTRNPICRFHAQGRVLQIPQISYRCLLLRATYRPVVRMGGGWSWLEGLFVTKQNAIIAL